jgi:hypothetical protein
LGGMTANVAYCIQHYKSHKALHVLRNNNVTPCPQEHHSHSRSVSCPCVLLAVNRQPLAVGQCCPACNATDWDSLQWSSALSSIQQRQIPVVLGSDVTQVQPPVAAAGSLRSVFVQGGLAQACAAPAAAACTQTVRWQLGAWGTCSSRCEGGHATRTAFCVDSTTGEPEATGYQAEAYCLPCNLCQILSAAGWHDAMGSAFFRWYCYKCLCSAEMWRRTSLHCKIQHGYKR